MDDTRTVWCKALGEKAQAFSVEVNSNASVDALKEALAAKKKYDTAAADLNLYLAIKDDDWLVDGDDDVEALSNPTEGSNVVARYVNPNNLMKATKKVSNYFGDTQYPAFDQDGRIHVVAVLPTAERGMKLLKPESAAVTLEGLWEYSELGLTKLPTTCQLQACLDKPLPFRLDLHHPEMSKVLFESSAPLLVCRELSAIIDGIAWQREVPISSNASVKSWIPFYHQFLCITTELCRANGLQLYQDRHNADPSDTSVMRPDYVILENYRVLLRGEEKALHNLGTALKHLIDKMHGWDVVLYGKLPFILGYATSGSVFEFVSIEPTDGTKCMVRKLVKFDFLLESAKAVRVFCNLAFLLYEMARLSSHGYKCGLLPFVPMSNETRTILLLDGVVQRTIHVASDRLVQVYKIVQGLTMLASSVTHLQTVNQMTRKGRSLEVTLSPVGYALHPEGDEAVEWLRHMLTALQHWHRTGYCHGDVRWPNMVYVPQVGDACGYWLLIDMDQAHKAGKATITWTSHTYRGYVLDFGHDLFQLGECLGRVYGELSASMQTMQTLLLSAVDEPVTADVALSKLDDLVQGTKSVDLVLGN